MSPSKGFFNAFDDVVILEAAHNVDYGVGLANIGEELVPQPFALRSTLHQTGDVHELNHRRQGSLGQHDFGQLCEAHVGYLHHADVRFHGAERVVRRFRAGGGKGIEERRLTDVRKANDAKLQHENGSRVGYNG